VATKPPAVTAPKAPVYAPQSSGQNWPGSKAKSPSR
jgi:hypothetical protein